MRLFARTASMALVAVACVAAVQARDTRGIAPVRTYSTWPAISSPVRRDASMERRIAQIVAGMTLEQKIGQMTQAEIRSITPAQVREFYIGSILNGGGAWPSANKRASVGDWVALSRAYYDASMSTDMKVPIPVIWGTDAVHGHNNVHGATLFPHNIGLGAARDPALVYAIARETALAARATGITWVFAPTLAVGQNARWGRTYESYSSDPAIVHSYAKAAVQGLQGQLDDPRSVVATAKHFMGDGGTYLGKDQGESRAALAEFINVHGQGYYAAVAAGVQSVMVSYNSWLDVASGVDYGKMHGSRALITEVLKERIGFDGLVISDWNAIEQVPGCTRSHCPQAINAGIDMVMVPEDWRAFIAETIADVNEGRVAMSRIDDAVARILRVKFRSGLFDRSPFATRETGQAGMIDSSASKALARRAVRESLVLLKNDSAVLPVSRAKKLLVVGIGANEKSRQLGGWSLTWQGTETEAEDFPQGDSFLSALRKTVDPRMVDYSATGTDVDATRYSAIIVVASEKPYAEMKGDISYPAPMQHSARYPEDLAALQAVAGKGTPVVTVLFSGRPVYANDFLNLSDAFVAAWLPGTEAIGIMDVLFRDTRGRVNSNFRGRLPFDWFGTPCPESDRDAILFKRGYGLSYPTASSLGKLSMVTAPSECARRAN